MTKKSKRIGSGGSNWLFGSLLIFTTEMDESHTWHSLFQMFKPKYKTNVNILCSVSFVHFHIVGYLSTSAAKALGSNIREAITNRAKMNLGQNYR